ncbi:ANTAR domain-containing protein [Arthrobacter sp. Ld5]|uniref:ANTAR domain-containing protein n=1 Tax=Arthrobacter sp. Ld5 TaxID=649152 RepID=UPI003EBFE253
MPTPSDEASSTIPGADARSRFFDTAPTGTFEYYFDTDSFHWSDEMFALHGYEPGQISPSLEVGLSHFPDGVRDQAAAYWHEVRTFGGPLSTYLTLQNAQGAQRQVLIVGDQILQDGGVVGVWGIMVDVSEPVRTDSDRFAREAVAASAAARGVIEQAKGILMGQTGVTADQAFRLLSQHSQDTNRKVSDIARNLVERAAGIGAGNARAFTDARAVVESI